MIEAGLLDVLLMINSRSVQSLYFRCHSAESFGLLAQSGLTRDRSVIHRRECHTPGALEFHDPKGSQSFFEFIESGRTS